MRSHITVLPILVFAACSGDPVDPATTSDAATAPVDYSAGFATAGLRASAGTFEFLDLTQCCATSCAGNNPSSPYGTVFVPAGPDETAPNPHARTDGLSDAFRLRADEAIVFVGMTPPPARYFGFTPYLNDRDNGNGGRRVVAASLSETLNDLVIGTDAAPGFGAHTAIIMTGDAGTETKVRTALVGAGFPADAINTLVFDPALSHFGSDAGADTFAMLFRVALPDDAAALDAYIAQPGAHVWRVTPQGAPAPSPLPSPIARPKNLTITETTIAPAVDALAAAIVAAYPDATAEELAVDDGVSDPAACIAGTAVCAFDNRDTTYPATRPSNLFQRDSDFYVVFGVDHAVADKVEYANVSVYALEHLVGIASAANPRYPGSAQQYVSANADQLYAYKIARSCGTDPYCLPIPVGDCPSGIQNNALGSIAFRTYLEPTTATAPSPTTLVRDRVLRFRR